MQLKNIDVYRVIVDGRLYRACNSHNRKTTMVITMMYFQFTIMAILGLQVANGFLWLTCCPQPSDFTHVQAAATSSEDRNVVEDTTVVVRKLSEGSCKMNRIMDPEFFSIGCDDMLKQLNSQIIKNVRVGESGIEGAGQGLFATKNIKAGSIVGFYPCHTLGVEIPADPDNPQLLFVSHEESDNEYFRQHPPSDASSYLHATDQPIFDRPSLLADLGPSFKDSPLYLDVNPNRNDAASSSPTAWVSHYINDGATMLENSQVGVMAYYSKSKAKKNCIHVPFGPSPIMATVATKKIKKGDELFTSYGCVYWIGVQYSGEQGVTELTGPIQEQINESARDLFAAMGSVATRYQNQIKALQIAFDNIHV